MTSPVESHAPRPRESGLAESGLAESGLAESGLGESGLDESGPAVGTALDEIRHACLLRDGTDPLDEATSLRIKYAGLGEHDRLFLAGDAGFLLALTDDATQPTELVLAVRPDVRRRGHANALLAAYFEDHQHRTISSWSHGAHPGAARLATTWGFDRVRALWVLRRPLSGPIPRPALPPGVTLRSYRPEDAAALLATNSAAFAGHPEQGAMDAASLAQRMAEPWFDPSGLLLAFDETDRMLGFHWTKIDPATASTAGQQIGEVYVIGVAPEAHGRGIGRLLMQAGLHQLSAQGSTEVMLYVEADNAPALSLYSSLGFSHADQDTHVRYQRDHRKP